MSLKLYFSLLRDYLHSLRFCLKVFPMKDAIRVPVNISRNIKVGNIYKGSIELKTPLRHNMIYIGHQGYSAIAEQEGLINVEPGGKLIFDGTARLAQGVRIWIDKDAVLKIGDNFYSNKNCLFRAFDNISIGKDVLLGWNIEMNTTDGHSIIIDGETKDNHGPIEIGNNVWIASHVGISKNSYIADNSVIAQRSLVTSWFDQTNVLLGGIPAKILKENINWKQ